MAIIRRFIILFFFLIPSFSYAQEEGEYIPDFHSAQYILASISYEGLGSYFTTSVPSRIANFYSLALTYGQVPDSNVWYENYGTLSPSCSVDLNSPDCSAFNASILDYAKQYQCRPEASAPSSIIHHHLNDFHYRFFRITGGSSSGQYFRFFIPDTINGPGTVDYNGSDSLSSTHTTILMRSYLYRSSTDSITDLAFSNPSSFNLLVQNFFSDYLSDSADGSLNIQYSHYNNSSGLYPGVVPRRSFIRNFQGDFKLHIYSMESPSDCILQDDGTYRFVFRPIDPELLSNDYIEFADGTILSLTPSYIAYNDDGYATLETDNSSQDFLYDPDPQYEEDYLPPGETPESWLDNPDNPFGSTHPDSPNNPLNSDDISGLGEDDFCTIDPETGECQVFENIEDLTDFSSIALQFKLILDPIFDFSALGGSQSCPTYSFGGNAGGFSFDQDIEIDCSWLDILGGIFLMLASITAFRLVMGD